MIENWQKDLSSFFDELSEVQHELAVVLVEKRQRLIDVDAEVLQIVEARENQLLARLQQCSEHRQELLAAAKHRGLPAESLQSALAALPQDDQRQALQSQLADAAMRCLQLRHTSITNWVLAQRSFIHISHLLKIIATGDHRSPTYDKEEAGAVRGGLLDSDA